MTEEQIKSLLDDTQFDGLRWLLQKENQAIELMNGQYRVQRLQNPNANPPVPDDKPLHTLSTFIDMMIVDVATRGAQEAFQYKSQIAMQKYIQATAETQQQVLDLLGVEDLLTRR